MAGYGFDPSWSDERRRLALLAQCYDPMTISRLTQLGVTDGWHCLDIGSGYGSVARWLGDRVGSGGRVVAMDIDTRFFEGEPGIEALRGDILTDDVEQGAFDLVHCRLLLHHLRGRQLDAVKRMATALRPGGVLVASECYLGGMRASSTKAFAELVRGLYAALPNADYDWAVNLPATVQAAGLASVEACGEVGFIRGGSPVAETIRLTFEAARKGMPDDIDVDAGLKLLDDPATFEPNFVWYTAWGRRN